jgi:hypothetical protein
MSSPSMYPRARHYAGPIQRLSFDEGLGNFVERGSGFVQFIKGPVPLAWITQANALPGKAGAVGIALWFLVGVKKSRTFRTTRQIEEIAACGRKAVYSALTALEGAGLIKFAPAQGARPSIEVLMPGSLGE